MDAIPDGLEASFIKLHLGEKMRKNKLVTYLASSFIINFIYLSDCQSSITFYNGGLDGKVWDYSNHEYEIALALPSYDYTLFGFDVTNGNTTASVSSSMTWLGAHYYSFDLSASLAIPPESHSSFQPWAYGVLRIRFSMDRPFNYFIQGSSGTGFLMASMSYTTPAATDGPDIVTTQPPAKALRRV